MAEQFTMTQLTIRRLDAKSVTDFSVQSVAWLYGQDAGQVSEA